MGNEDGNKVREFLEWFFRDLKGDPEYAPVGSDELSDLMPDEFDRMELVIKLESGFPGSKGQIAKVAEALGMNASLDMYDPGKATLANYDDLAAALDGLE